MNADKIGTTASGFVVLQGQSPIPGDLLTIYYRVRFQYRRVSAFIGG